MNNESHILKQANELENQALALKKKVIDMFVLKKGMRFKHNRNNVIYEFAYCKLTYITQNFTPSWNIFVRKIKTNGEAYKNTSYLISGTTQSILKQIEIIESKEKAHLNLIRYALDNECEVGVWYDDEYDLEPCTDFEKIKENAETCDEIYLRIFHKEKLISVAFLVFEVDQDPQEIICDYTDNSWMDKWAKQYYDYNQ